jgi:hypothetical protein
MMMNEERRKILEMVREGKVSTEEGLQLMEAMEQGNETSQPVKSQRFFRVRVDGAKTKVNVKIPMNLIKVASKFAGIGMNFIPEDARREMEKKGIDLSTIDFEELVGLIDEGLVDGKLVDVETEDPGEGQMKVEIYVD